MRVQEVDPGDDAAFAGWFGVLDASLAAERPGEPHWTAREQRALALGIVGPGGDRDGALLAAVQGDVVVGAGRLVLPTSDNLHLAMVVLHVHPAHRRRGAGTALLDELCARARAAGRRVLTTEIDEPPGDVPGTSFARRHAAVCALREVRRDLALPADPARLAALAAACRPYSAGYQVVTWRDRTPKQWLSDRALLSSRMSTEVPLGDLPWEQEAWDEGRLQAYEDGILAQGRTWFTAAAVLDGRLVAFTDVGVPVDAPTRAYQWSTLVLPEHRGHRLGTVVKLAALRELVAAVPGARVVTTFNAEVNAAMIAVNQALGFAVTGGLSGWRLDL